MVRRIKDWLRGMARRVRSDSGMTTSEYAVGTIVIYGCQAITQVSRRQCCESREGRAQLYFSLRRVVMNLVRV